MNIIEKRPDELIPYENNPRDNDAAVPYVANSIREFGFQVPIVIDRNNVIVSGHTRHKAAKLLNLETVPCVIADNLTEEQIKAFRIADNKVAEQASWDFGKLEIELADIDMDMSDFGLDFEPGDFIDLDEEEGPDEYHNERERTNRKYNLDIIDWSSLSDDFWQMPIIQNDGFIPSDLIAFHYRNKYPDKHVGLHFYIDDYKFERTWTEPSKYVDCLAHYDCILSPDFSLYMDMPIPMKIWNTYRSRQIGAYYQQQGIRVIPTISWAEPETFEFCFRGIPKESIVSTSTIGIKKDPEAVKIWKDGVDEMIRQIQPSAILIYGGEIEYDFKDIEIHYYKHKTGDIWKTWLDND